MNKLSIMILGILIFIISSSAVEKRPFTEVNTDAFTDETQKRIIF